MTRRTRLLLAVAASAVIAGGAISKASAFEIVDWEWQTLVNTDWDIDVLIDVEYDPTGIVQIEKLQMHFGDVNSFAKVFGVENNPPLQGEISGEPIVIETNVGGNIEWETGEPVLATNNPVTGGSYLPDNDAFTITPLAGGNADESDGADGNDAEFLFHVAVTVDPSDLDFELLFGEPILADALPEVINAATSVANNQQITSSSALLLHDAQIAAGDINQIGGDCGNECSEPDPLAFLIGAYLLTEVDDELDGLNEHTDIAALTILGAATGFIEPADIDADAWVFDILNATVDNSATAVGNNASYEVTAADPLNAIMVADLTQLLIGDVNAVALTGFVEVNNYDLTGLDRPLVSNVATAVGNNLNIKVGIPEPGDDG